MRNQSPSSVGHVRVIISVIPMPVRVNRKFQRGLPEAIDGFLETVPRILRKGIHEQLAVLAVQDNNVSARTPQEGEVLRKLCRLNRNFSETRPSCRQCLGMRRTTPPLGPR